MASLFVMGGVDYTRFITVPSYKVVSKPVTKDYEDITKTSHKQFVRNKISGSFTLKFFSDSSYEDVSTTKSAIDNYQSFFDEYNRLKSANGLVTVTVYVNNLNTTKEIQAYLEMDPPDTMPYMDTGKSYDGFDVTISQK